MRNLWKSVLGLWVIGMGLGVSAPAQAASGIGPYYAMPAWDQTLPAATRFIVLTNMGSEAVLDRETGLVWEQSPDTNVRDWEHAQFHCIDKTVGNRDGWRLPTVQELKSLVDRTQTNPALPAAHPFINVGSSSYWSATIRSSATFTTDAWSVRFFLGETVGSFPKSRALLVWCVRGGQGPDAQ